MKNRVIKLMAGTALAVMMSLGHQALAQDIEFGDDSSTWANDGQCDDPRFEGPGAASFQSPLDNMRDATDCRAAFEAGDVTLAEPNSQEPAETADAVPAGSGEIDFGDDSGTFANDGECDDPRFGGILDSHEMADATDCRAAYEAGDVEFTEPGGEEAAETGEIDFGTDEGMFANDGECDDPRFGGALTSHEMADATDCRTAYEAGEVTFVGGEPAVDSVPDMETGDIDFGDDSGNWANDGECDDPRFTGPGVGVALDDHLMADATDCRTAFEAGEVSLAEDEPEQNLPPIDQVDFGDDSGNWANDGECDDPRFGGALSSHAFADATDCRAAYEAGNVTYDPDAANPSDAITIDGIDFGNDTGIYANDGECDDPRFTGPGMGASLDDHLMADASDCSSAYEEGTVTLLEAGQDTSDFRINFGDDSSATAFNGVCDDPRFQGRGAAPELLETDLLADASDCRDAYEAGTVTYSPR